MNKHILLVMKYLKDPKSVSQEELGENSKSAGYADYFAYDAYYAVVYDAAYDAAYYADAANANAAADAAYYAADADVADADVADAAHWVDKYFEHTGEDKQTYLDALEKS